MTALIKYDEAKRALAEAVRLDEVLRIRDFGEALAAAGRIARDGDLLRDAIELRVRAERRCGELIAQMRARGELAGNGGDRKSVSRETRLILSDVGITHDQSARYCALAARDGTEFEALIVARQKQAVGAAEISRDEKQAEKKRSREARERTLAVLQRALPSKKYGVIYADPAWRFEVFSRNTGMDRAADNHYSTMGVDEICALDVASIAAADSVLFMWVTAPFLRHGFRVIEAWGFDYVSRFVWAKDRVGNGYWVRDDAEELLIGKRGNVPAPAMGDQFTAVQRAPVGAHSAKPERFAEIIESYFPHLPKIELNRRGAPRAGWDAWGNEAS